MNLVTRELSNQVLDKDLRKLISRINCFEEMQMRAMLHIANGNLEDAVECIEEQLKDIREILLLAEEATAWKNTHRLMSELQGLGFNIKMIEVKRR